MHNHLFKSDSNSESNTDNTLTPQEQTNLFDTTYPQAKESLSHWWQKQGGLVTTAPLALLKELEEQMAKVDGDKIDARFVPLIWSHT